MKELFLDSNAHLPLNTLAQQAYLEFISSSAGHGHPSSLSVPGRAAAAKLETCRAEIAEMIGATKPGQIIFTSTCTQAAEWAAQLLKDAGDNLGVRKLSCIGICSKLEHSSVIDAAKNGFGTPVKEQELKFIPNNKDGINLVDEIDNNLLLKSICVHVQNELGTIQPIKKLKGRSEFILSDISQSIGKIPVSVTELDLDFAIFSPHKFGGPGGIGVMYVKNTSYWRPFGTGSRYFLDRAGTPDVAAIVATTVALKESLKTLPNRTDNMKSFQNYLENKLSDRGIEVVGKNAERSPNTTFIYLPGVAANILLELGEVGIHVGLGSACGSMHTGSSPTIKALGREGTIQDYIRISQYGEYDLNHAKTFIEALDKIL